MPSKKPAKKAPPQRYYLVEGFDDIGSFVVYLGQYRDEAERCARDEKDARITTYARMPSKRAKAKRGKR